MAVNPLGRPESRQATNGPNIANRVTSAFYVRRLKSKRSALRLTLAASGMSMVIELRGMNEYGHMIDGRPVPAH